MTLEFDDESVGNLLRVSHVDKDNVTAFLAASDGRTWRVTGSGVQQLGKDDLVFVDDREWSLVKRHEPMPNIQTSVIYRVLDDGTILGELGNLLIQLQNPHGVEVKQDSTVEIDGMSNIVRRIAEEPLRGAQHPADAVESAASFLIPSPKDGLTFEDFGGYGSVVKRAKELIETQIERRAELSAIGAKPVKGVLFSGPPGTGKTHLARIIASQSGANFYEISGPAILSKWVGDSEGMLRRIFEHAQNAPSQKSIIFFDEIDSIAESRSGDTHEASRKLVAQFLTLMDGFHHHSGTVIVIAATNRVEALDPALMRPGRFDWEIEFPMPSVIDRLEILQVASKKIKCIEELPLVELAVRSSNWSPARLMSIWTEAATIATADGRARIAGEDMAQGFERVAARPAREPNEK